jgi:integrase
MSAKPVIVRAGSASVRIYQRSNKGYPDHIVSYYLYGKRVQKSFANPRAARTHANEAAALISAGNGSALEFSGAERESYQAAKALATQAGLPLLALVREHVKATELADGGSLIDAAREYAERRRLPGSSTPPQQVVDEMLKAKEQDGASPRYLQQLGSDLRRFAADFRKPLGSITTNHMEQWLRSLGLAPRSRNNLRVSLVTLFSFARHRGYLDKQRKTEAESVSKAKVKDSEVEVFTPEQMERILTGAPAKLLPFMTIGAFAGLRTSEIQRLEWNEIDFESGYIRVSAAKAKTASRRLVPIPENLRLWLAPLAGNGRVLQDKEIWRDVTARARNLGIEWPKNVLRHSAISYRLAELQDVAQVALEAGNSPQIIFKHYRQVVTPAQAERWFSINPKSV